MQGMGDAVWQRPAVEFLLSQYDEVYLSIAWPQLYEDLREASHGRLKLLRPSGFEGSRMYYEVDRYLNFDKAPWRTISHHAIRLVYHVPDCTKPIIPTILERAYAPVDLKWKLSLPHRWTDEGLSLRQGHQRVVLVRPPTVRSEWPCSARCGDPAAYQYLIDRLEEGGYHVIEVGTTCEQETLFGKELCHSGDRYLHGELSPTQLWGLASVVDLVITGPCNILPLAMAYDRQVIGIWGGYEAPWLTVHNYDKICSLTPTPFEPVPDMNHNPNRRIRLSDLDRALEVHLVAA